MDTNIENNIKLHFKDFIDIKISKVITKEQKNKRKEYQYLMVLIQIL